MFKIRIYLKSFDFYVLDKIIISLKDFFKEFNISFIGPIFLPNKIEKFDILRSPHIYKNSRDQFAIITYKRFIDINDILKKDYFLKIKEIYIYYNLDFFYKFIKNNVKYKLNR